MGKKKETKEVELRLVETLEDVELTVYKDLIKKEDCIYTINKDEKTCTLHKLLKVYETLYIPDKIDNYEVTVLENKESEAIFESTDEIQVKTVVLPLTIKTIGKHCFNECRSVENFVINEGVELIDVAGFSYCEGIEEIILPESLNLVEDYAFRNCSNLKRITFKNPNTKIADDLYTITTSKNIPNGLGKFDGIIYSLIPSKVKEYAEKFNKNFELYDYVKMDISYNGIRPTSNDINFIKKDDIEVLATWSNKIVDKIDNYDLKIDTEKDKMILNIHFDKFDDKIILSTKSKEIDKIEVSYHGAKKIKIKNPLNKDDFTVIVYYDNGTSEEIKDFIFTDEFIKVKGINTVSVEYKNHLASCTVVGKKGFLWF